MSEPTINSAPIVEDCTGKVITAGDPIVYPVRRGSSLWMEHATVSKVEQGALGCIKSNGRRVTIKNLKNVVKV